MLNNVKNIIQKTHKTKTKLHPLPSRTFVDLHSWAISTWEKKFNLTENWKSIIQRARSEHKIVSLVPDNDMLEGKCAGYLYELTAKIRWPTSPYNIGMMHPKTKRASSARDLPYSYRYRWATIPISITKEIGQKTKKDPSLYPFLISSGWIQEFFMNAWSGASLLWDIWFLYKYTESAWRIGVYGNYNSHIGKNFWISVFNFVIEHQSDYVAKTIRDTLWCSDDNMRQHVKLLFPYYTWKINNETVTLALENGELVFRNIINRDIVTLDLWDILSYDDITVIHFYKGAKVRSLLQMTCQGNFYPINVIQIKENYLEKT